jgi:hypothetical protein
MSTRTQIDTEHLVKGLLSDAATGASTTLDLLRDGASRATQTQRDALVNLLRANEARMDPSAPCGFFDPPLR